jgi:di/tricarboxylate transporter
MEIFLVLCILVAAVGLFAMEKLSVDLVALLVLVALLLCKLITPAEGVSGFSHPATVTVAAMFVLSSGLQKTGAVQALGGALARVGGNYTLLLMVIMGGIGFVSAFINNTAAVAVFLPFVLAASSARKISSSRLLIPLSYASQFGGVCTLIGTSTNLLVSAISEKADYGAFTMFEFSKLGGIMFGAGLVYFLLIGRWLLPDRKTGELTADYALREYLTELRVLGGSPLIGKTVRESEFGARHDVTVLELLRGGRNIWSPTAEPVREGDVLLVRGKVKNIMGLKENARLQIEPEFQLKDESLEGADLTLVEVLVAPKSSLAGYTLRELDFYWRFNSIVLAIQRHGHTVREKLRDVRLHFGDALLLIAPKDEVPRLRSNDNIIVLGEVETQSSPSGKAPLALAIVTMVVALAALNVLPILVASLIGCAAMAMTRCLSLDDAYQAIDWKVIMLLGGILPLGIAMENTGAAEKIAGGAMSLFGTFGPLVALAAIYLVTAILTACMSNISTALLLAPIAISTALQLDVNPKPFLVAVTFAASTSFATPVGYHTNTMVYNAGAYRFTDFMKVGIPLNLIFWAWAVYLIPKFWPF